MSALEERRLYFQIHALSYGPALDIVHHYFETKVLHGTPIKNFFDSVTHKHKLFHEYIRTVPCCECSNLSLASSSKRGCLGSTQFCLIYDNSGQSVTKHEKRKGRDISQHCLCKFCTKPSLKITDMDLILICAVIQICCPSLPCHPTWLKDLKDVRNYLVHKGDSQIDKTEFQSRWKLLETATLELAGLVGTACYKMFKREIERLNTASLDDLKKVITESNDDIRGITGVLNGMKPFQAAMSDKLEELSSQQKAQEENQKQMMSMLECIMYSQYGELKTVSDVNRHYTDEKTTECKDKCDDSSRRHDVLVSIKTPSSWDKAKIEENLSARLQQNEQQSDDQLEFIGFKFKCLILTTRASERLINDKTALLAAIGFFLKGIFEDCGVDTSIPETVHIVIDVYCPLPSGKIEKAKEESVQMKREIKTLQHKFDQAVNIQDTSNDRKDVVTTSRTYDEKAQGGAGFYDDRPTDKLDMSDDLIVCSNCYRTFSCKKCTIRMRKIGKLEQAIKEGVIQKISSILLKRGYLKKNITGLDVKQPPKTEKKILGLDIKQPPKTETEISILGLDLEQPPKTERKISILGSFIKDIVAAYDQSNTYASTSVDKLRLFLASSEVIMRYTRKSRKDLWTDILDNVFLGVLQVVDFANMIPEFPDLCNNDKILLLKNGCFPVLVTFCCNAFDPEQKTVMFGDSMVPLSVFHSLNDDEKECRDEIFHLLKIILSLKLTITETALFCAFLIFKPALTGLKEIARIAAFRGRVMETLQLEIETKHVSTDKIYEKLTEIEQKLHSLSSQLTTILNKLKLSYPDIIFAPLLNELFNV